MVSVQALANTVLKKSFEESIPVSPMKLQKLLYFIYRDYLQTYHKKLISEDFLCWPYGPVLQSAYYEFKSFRAQPITRFAKDANDNVFIINSSLAPEIEKCITKVWDQYKHCSGLDLSKLTHSPETAWSKANDYNNTILDDEDINNEEIR